MKFCNACGETKPLEDFYTYQGAKGRLPRSQCKLCVNKRGAKNQKGRWATPEEKARKAEYRRRCREENSAKLRRGGWKRQGINPDLAEQYFLAHDGKCEICGSQSEQVLHVDHCHDTNKIRGMLCRTCNLGLGNFKDSKDLLSKAVAYLTAKG